MALWSSSSATVAASGAEKAGKKRAAAASSSGKDRGGLKRLRDHTEQDEEAKMSSKQGDTNRRGETKVKDCHG